MINPEILLNFEENDIIPVISPVASDEKENTHLLDVNLTASMISAALDADHLVLLGDKSPLCEKNLKIRDIYTLREMLRNDEYPKETGLIEAAISALENSTDCVHFIDGSSPDAILLSMFMGKGE